MNWTPRTPPWLNSPWTAEYFPWEAGQSPWDVNNDDTDWTPRTPV